MPKISCDLKDFTGTGFPGSPLKSHPVGYNQKGWVYKNRTRKPDFTHHNSSSYIRNRNIYHRFQFWLSWNQNFKVLFRFRPNRNQKLTFAGNLAGLFQNSTVIFVKKCTFNSKCVCFGLIWILKRTFKQQYKKIDDLKVKIYRVFS